MLLSASKSQLIKRIEKLESTLLSFRISECDLCLTYEYFDNFKQCEICYAVSCQNCIRGCFTCESWICMLCMWDKYVCWFCQYRNETIFNGKYYRYLPAAIQSQIFTLMLSLNRFRDKYWAVPKFIAFYIITFIFDIDKTMYKDTLVKQR